MAEHEYAISFWAHQFAQHFTFIAAFLKRYDIEKFEEYGEELKHFETAWMQVQHNPNSLTDALMNDTLRIKKAIKKQVKHLPCIPALITHMLEELNYFDESILQHKYTLQDEIEYWSKEHAENLEFVGCELPRLIQEDGKGSIPNFLKQMLEEGAQLANEFKQQNNFEEFMLLKQKHLESINKLLHKLPHIPLNKQTMQDVKEMLQHEKHEAMFASLYMELK